ncbi:MAG: Mur ligase family protein [Patescibacteria group bacterium]|nr:Mur ligase family protein [Patescibacteria group bacterium]
MDFLLKIAKPDYSIFTKLDYIHVQNFDSKKSIGLEKIKLINNTKIKAFINKRDDFLDSYSKHLKVDYSFFNKKDSYKNKYVLENNKIFSLIKFDNDVIKTNIL